MYTLDHRSANILKMLLEKAIESLLPKSETPYHVLNVSSAPKISKKIFHNNSRQTTVKTQHFITICQDQKPIYGIEIFVYIIVYDDHTERLLFISKADTTGLFDSQKSKDIPLNVSAITKGILKYVLRIPLSFYLTDVIGHNHTKSCNHSKKQPYSRIQLSLQTLARRWKENSDVAQPSSAEHSATRSRRHIDHKEPVLTKICLFTRPEPQYLFPYSNKNAAKHILTGEQLLKWWCNLVDSVVEDDFEKGSDLKILIPGAEKRTIQRFFPTDKWTIGDIFSPSSKEVAIYRIPLFPDDPKGRFLEHLVVENRAKTVKTGQFWLELSVRQEFRLGIVVGVIGISGLVRKANLSSSPEGITVLKSKVLKKVKDFIVQQDYSIPEDLETLETLKKLPQVKLLQVYGTMTKALKRKVDETKFVQQQPMMVIKKKKKV